MDPRHRFRMLALVTVVAGAVALGGCARPSEQVVTDLTPVAQAFARASVATDGAVRVERAAPGAGTTVERTVHAEGAVPPPAVRVDGDVLVVDGRCGDGCLTDVVLRLPAATPVAIDTTAGAVAVSGSGPVTARSQAGAIRLADVAGAAAATSQAGAVDVEGASGPVDAGSEAGAVTVGVVVPTDVRARSAAADVTVTVPRGDYRVRADDIDGPTSAVADDPAAPHALEVVSTAGQARVEVR